LGSRPAHGVDSRWATAPLEGADPALRRGRLRFADLLGRLQARPLPHAREQRLHVGGDLSRGDARELVVSHATVKTHVRNVLAKLDLRDRVHAVVFAYESGLVRAGAE